MSRTPARGPAATSFSCMWRLRTRRRRCNARSSGSKASSRCRSTQGKRRPSISRCPPKLAFFDERLNRYTVDDARDGIQIAGSAADSDVEQQRFVSVHGSLPSSIDSVNRGRTTVSTRFVVRVLTQADRLFVGGRSLRGFSPGTFSYDVGCPTGPRRQHPCLRRRPRCPGDGHPGYERARRRFRQRTGDADARDASPDVGAEQHDLAADGEAWATVRDVLLDRRHAVSPGLRGRPEPEQREGRAARLNGAGTTSDLSVAFDYFHVTNPRIASAGGCDVDGGPPWQVLLERSGPITDSGATSTPSS